MNVVGSLASGIHPSQRRLQKLQNKALARFAEGIRA
jgi:hypothetical protein